MKEWDVNATESMGSTALTWAAIKGQEEVVKMLLEREDVNRYIADLEYGCMPLLWATGKGHEGAVNMLLELPDVNPNQTDTKYRGTPLSWAAGSRHAGSRDAFRTRRCQSQPDRPPVWPNATLVSG